MSTSNKLLLLLLMGLNAFTLADNVSPVAVVAYRPAFMVPKIFALACICIGLTISGNLFARGMGDGLGPRTLQMSEVKKTTVPCQLLSQCWSVRHTLILQILLKKGNWTKKSSLFNFA